MRLLIFTLLLLIGCSESTSSDCSTCNLVTRNNKASRETGDGNTFVRTDAVLLGDYCDQIEISELRDSLESDSISIEIIDGLIVTWVTQDTIICN